MSSDSERMVDALSSALMVADLGDAKSRAGFLRAVADIAEWASNENDITLAVMAEEIGAVMQALDAGELEPAAATGTVTEIITVTLEACAQAQSQPKRLDAENNVYAADPQAVSDFICGAFEQLDHAESLLSVAATGGTVDVDELFRCIHTIKGMSGFLSLDELATVGHRTETLLETVRSSRRDMTDPEVETALQAVDAMREMVSALETTPTAEKSAQKQVRKRASDQVRVNASRLEELLDAMGELAVAEAELAAAVYNSGDLTALRCLERLERISREMQGTATTLRMVSLKQTFTKMSRVVRDGISHSGKSAELFVSGEQTEIDRAIVEALADPLVHLLRNAVDHGIETPAERAAAGKTKVGRIELSAFHRSGSVYIEIRDDGRGIDPDRLVRKATEAGMEFDRDHPLSLIFRPGFSTAATLSEMSGRGVGMDAVAAAVASLRGQLDVASEPGFGTCFTIRLPLTLAIIDGIVLRAGSERYVVPTHFVERTASVVGEDIVSVAGSGHVIVLPDGPVPEVSLAETMGASTETGNVAVILVDGDDRFAILVDEVIGQQSLVIKPLTGPTSAAVGPAGAALMADGRVALVMDPAGLAKAVRSGVARTKGMTVRSAWAGQEPSRPRSQEAHDV